jgi:hypothetical protein
MYAPFSISLALAEEKLKSIYMLVPFRLSLFPFHNG